MTEQRISQSRQADVDRILPAGRQEESSGSINHPHSNSKTRQDGVVCVMVQPGRVVCQGP